MNWAHHVIFTARKHLCVILFTGGGSSPPSPIRSTSGRYASYWNAYLFQSWSQSADVTLRFRNEYRLLFIGLKSVFPQTFWNFYQTIMLGS